MSAPETLDTRSERRALARHLLPAVLIGMALWLIIAALGVIVVALHPSLASVAVLLMVLLSAYLIVISIQDVR